MKNIPLFQVAMSPNQNTDTILQSGYIGQGKVSDEFEEKLKLQLNNRNVAVVNSCTSAIHLAFEDVIRRLKQEGTDRNNIEVLSTSLSCFATVSPILSLGLKLKWVDIDPITCNIDLADLSSKLNENTRVVIFVHWGGNLVNLNKIHRIKADYKKKYGYELYVIEDCAHVWHNDYKYKKYHNNYEAYSFQAIKFLTTVDGGALVCPNLESYKNVKLMRWFGLDREAGQSFRCAQDIQEFGYKMQPNDVLSSVGIANLNLANTNVNKQVFNAAYLTSKLSNVKGIIIPPVEVESSYWLYTIHVERKFDFEAKMKEKGIAVSPVHNRMDFHSCVSDYLTDLPNMDKVSNTMICIPVGWWLTIEDLDYIIESINGGW